MYSNAEAKVAYMRGEYTRAAEMFRECARDGDAEAAFNYGYCLLHGMGTERDPSEAKSYFVFAQELDGGEAAYNLASMYISGTGVKRNFKRGIEYMKSSARLGCAEAQLYLGMAYTLGAVLDPEITCVSLIPFHTPEYRSDIPLLDGQSSCDIAEEEEERLSVIIQDPRSAFEYFRAAARHDATYVGELVAKGKYLYAKCYADGFGVEFNREKTVRLMLAAGRSGSEDAARFLAEYGVSSDLLTAPSDNNNLTGGR